MALAAEKATEEIAIVRIIVHYEDGAGLAALLASPLDLGERSWG